MELERNSIISRSIGFDQARQYTCIECGNSSQRKTFERYVELGFNIMAKNVETLIQNHFSKKEKYIQEKLCDTCDKNTVHDM